jgi:hypothetical protein
MWSFRSARISFAVICVAGLVLTNRFSSSAFSDELLEFERKQIPTNYKFGVLYQKLGQTEEDQVLAMRFSVYLTALVQFYNNQDTSPEFEEFLLLLGDKVALKGWNKFRGGLSVAGMLT